MRYWVLDAPVGLCGTTFRGSEGSGVFWCLKYQIACCSCEESLGGRNSFGVRRIAWIHAHVSNQGRMRRSDLLIERRCQEGLESMDHSLRLSNKFSTDKGIEGHKLFPINTACKARPWGLTGNMPKSRLDQDQNSESCGVLTLQIEDSEWQQCKEQKSCSLVDRNSLAC